MEKKLNIGTNKLLSETIGVLRFPLMVCVVLIHTIIPNQENHLIVDIFNCYIVNLFVHIAVPLFFFISGFLFFYGVDRFGRSEYWNKLKKRVKRIFVPFVFWGMLFMIIKYVSCCLGFEDVDYIFNHPLKWIYFVLWNPINFPLWFVRDLIFVIIISPLIYMLIKRLKIVSVIFMGFAWLFYHGNIFELFGIELYLRTSNIFNVVGCNFVPLFFFSFGAWFVLEKRDFALDFKRLFPMAIIVFVVCTIGKFVIANEYWAEVSKIAIISGLMSAVVIVYELVKKGWMKRNLFLENGSQFIYYYHAIFLMYYMKILYYFDVFDVDNELFILGVYISIPIITILLGLWLYKVGMRYMPRVMNFVLGLK